MNTYQSQQSLIDSVNNMIDAASFRQCYERRDPRVNYFVIVSPSEPLAEVAATLLEGTHEPTTLGRLGAEGVVKMIPTINSLLGACGGMSDSEEDLRALRLYLAGLTRISDLLSYFAPASPAKKTLALLPHLRDWMDLEVLAFYCPPAYFVQFTGKRWE